MKSAVSGLKRDGGWAPAKEIVQLAAFTVGGEQYALDIMRIKEIINPLKITPVPKAPSFIEGVVELRGVILPVVDMRKRFELAAAPATRASKYLIVAIDGLVAAKAPADPAPQRWIVGLIVDGVQEVIRVPRAEISPAPAMAVSADGRYFSGVCHHRDRIVMVLDLEALLSQRERASLEHFAGAPGQERA
ncbi:MAG: chemotaxis protein CheW [Myxococcales bacterium]|nr:chemotaxis protein CheW [Myxococcales bacterium]